MHLPTDDLLQLAEAAIAAAIQAGQMIASYAPQQVAVNTKHGGTSLAAQVVTEVDHKSQDLIMQALQPSCERYGCALLSEESPDDRARLSKDYFWCIDPLDGTLPFIEGVPGYSVSIALVSRAGEPLLGVVYDPLRQTLYHAIKGQGAWRNRQAFGLANGAGTAFDSLTPTQSCRTVLSGTLRASANLLPADLSLGEGEPSPRTSGSLPKRLNIGTGAEIATSNALSLRERVGVRGYDGCPHPPSDDNTLASPPTLIFITDKSFAHDPLYAATVPALQGIATELGFNGAELRLQGGAALNACQVLDAAPACYFKFPKPQTGGGSVWDYAATACLFQELGAPVSDFAGQPLRLNPEGSTFMNHCGVLYCSDATIARRMLRLYRQLQGACAGCTAVS